MTLVAGTNQEAEQAAAEFVERFTTIREEVGKFIVGQRSLIEDVLLAVVCGGNVLLEGVPGLGKTALVHSISEALHLAFRRIQFTPDLLPADIVGTQVLVERDGAKVLEFAPGPVFCNVLLADEINRATPKTQSALLETMQEKSVTVAGQTHRLDEPFFVLATQNPIEQDGTYPLPEAQLDRFFFKLLVETPSHDEFSEILNRTGGNRRPEVSPVADGEDILRMGRTLRETPIDNTVQDFLVRVVRATHPESEDAPANVQRFVRHGASPRGAQAMLAAARARALLAGRYHVSREDVAAVAVPALRHRIILSFEGEADGVKTDEVIADVLKGLK
ncbi:ATPase family associated with various cellular activities (AAA) [Planctomycetes bacterium MalM25]|nr:ATPase family associated with various cellular activities (AAA) [Planctomycetes bacterium MalM25]